MERKKPTGTDLEVVVKVPPPQLTRKQVSALKKAFKSILVATLAAAEVKTPKQAVLKRVSKRIQVTKRPPAK